MRASKHRYSSTRQKVCESCSSAKAKCDRKAGTCGRCAQRGLLCTYPQPESPRAPTGNTNVINETDILGATAVSMRTPISRSAFDSDTTTTVSRTETSSPTGEAIPPVNRVFLSDATVSTFDTRFLEGRAGDGPAALDFSRLDLVCPINADDIQNRWLNSFMSVPGQIIKALPNSVTAFTFRILKSYTAMAIRGRGIPPFVHSTQTHKIELSQPLSTCLGLIRICDKPSLMNAEVAVDVLQREMNKLYEQHGTYDDITVLTAFQAYLIYALVLYFQIGRDTVLFLRQNIMNLQQIACSCAGRGLICSAERDGTRPRWEAWVVTEAKRRTLFTMYLFDNVLSVEDGLPTFLGTELQGLPAPASKYLWQPTRRDIWEKAYNLHLAEWMEGSLRIDELWPIPADLDAGGVAKRQERVDQWLEGIDEFGTMLYAVTCCTHGG